MKYYRQFKNSELKIGQHKLIECFVRLTIDLADDDQFAEIDRNVDYSQYIDGVKVTGELEFTIPTINWNDKHPVRPAVEGHLKVTAHDASTKMNILFIKRTNEFIEGKLRRYCWEFIVPKKPDFDKLELFPKHYQGVAQNMNKVYVCTNFRGSIHSENVSSVIIAPNKQIASDLLIKKLAKYGLYINPLELKFEEIDTRVEGVPHIEVGD